MATTAKRALVTLCPEWEPKLEQLKKEQFYNDTQAEMFRYIISRGLEAMEAEKEGAKNDEPKTA